MGLLTACRRGLAVAAAALLAAFPAGAVTAEAPRCRSAGVGLDGFCNVDGARLHFVDWGGDGPPLVLLAGFGATARTFDDLAPRLSAGRRVYAFTRRGFGQSQQTPGAYAARRFTDDLVGLMDALGLARADVVGHSAAGAEMVRLASTHPGRIRRLVYLDAAYDFTDALALQAADPVDRSPGADALVTWEAAIRRRKAMLGADTSAIEADLRQTVRLHDGRLVPVTPPQEAAAIASALLPGAPPYSAVIAPSLAIYAPKTEPEQLPPGATSDQRAAAYVYGLRRIRPWMLREQARFLGAAPCGVAFERPGATHHMYLTHPDWTARTILSFLDSPETCSWRPAAPPGD